MSTRAVFSYENLDDTADLNAHFRALVAKGVVSGGKVVPVAGTSNVTISPFYAASNDGMIIWSDTTVTVACSPGQVNYVVLRAVYNAPSDPTLSYECMSVSAYNSDPQKSYLVVFATVDLSTVSTVSAAAISYNLRDVVDVVSHSAFLGSYATITERDAAWPSIQPTAQKTRDFVLVTSAVNSLPAFYEWNGSTWIAFGNYEQLASDFASHTAGVVGTGSTVHTTADEKAALAGTAGAPSASNRFVTESDQTLILTADQKAAIASAVSGPVKATNPLVANNVPVTIPLIVAFTPTTQQDFVNITFGNTGAGPYFGAPVYVGKLGLDTGNARSSATGWFSIQDAYFNGYVDEEGPLYVTDIQDYTGSGSYNPASDLQNVTSIGYWTPATQTAAIRIKFNRKLSGQKTIYIRCYVKGTIAQLAPEGPYYPSSTATFGGQIAHQEVYSQKVTYQQATVAEVETLKAYAGTQTQPSITFLPNTKTGFYYIGNISEYKYDAFSGIGATVNGDTVLVLAKSSSGESQLDNYEMPLVIEQSLDGDSMSGRIRIHAHKGSDNTPSLDALEIGLSSYASGFIKYLTIGTNDAGREGVTFSQTLMAASGKQFRADPGTEAAPGIAFTTAPKTGFRYIGSTSIGEASTYNSLGIVLNGKTCFVFSSNLDTPTADASTPLMFEQVRDSGVDLFTTRIGVQRLDGNYYETAVSFGHSDYNADWNEYAVIDGGGIRVSGNVVATGLVGIDGGWYVTSGVAGSTMTHGSIDLMSYTSATGTSQFKTLGNDFSHYVKILDPGLETYPAIRFMDNSNGIFFKDAIGGGINNSAGEVVRSAMCFVSGGKTVLAVGRNSTLASSDLGTLDMPLVIEQVVDGVSTPQVQISLMHRINDAHHQNRKISFGFGNYTDDFVSWMDLNTGVGGEYDVTFRRAVEFKSQLVASGNVEIKTQLTIDGNFFPSNIATSNAADAVNIGHFQTMSWTPTAAITGSGKFIAAAITNTATHTFANATSAGLGLSGSAVRLTDSYGHGITVSGIVIDSTQANAGVVVGTSAKPATLYGRVIDTTAFPFTLSCASDQAMDAIDTEYGTGTIYGALINAPLVFKATDNTITLFYDFTSRDMTSRNNQVLGLNLSINDFNRIVTPMSASSRVCIELIAQLPEIKPSWVRLNLTFGQGELETGNGSYYAPIWTNTCNRVYVKAYAAKNADGDVSVMIADMHGLRR